MPSARPLTMVIAHLERADEYLKECIVKYPKFADGFDKIRDKIATQHWDLKQLERIEN